MDATLPAINSTPSCLNLLALEPSGASYDRPLTSGAQPVLRKALTEFAIALHTVMLVFALVHAHESWVATVVLLVLVPFHPLVLHFVMHWWRWRRDVALACHGAVLQEKHIKHIECSACSKCVQRGQAVFLAFDLTFCSAGLDAQQAIIRGAAAAAAGADADVAVPRSSQLNLVVAGHVDAGKSTLMGRLLAACGRVDARTLHKYEREAAQAGKASFKWAWVLDQDSEERARGVTIEVGVAHFESARLKVNVLDTPGHRDFVPNMIGGAAQADAALLLLNAAASEFEAGLCGQTAEHLLLLRALGVRQLVVVVNKMDAANWEQQRYEEIVAGVAPLLAQAGWRMPLPPVVPISALAAQNLTPDAPAAGGGGWYPGRTLLEEIDALEPADRRESKGGAQLCVNDVYRSLMLGPATVSGTLQAGTLSVGQPLMLLPGGGTHTVKALASRGEAAAAVTAGDHVELSLAPPPDEGAIGAGSLLCDPSRPVPLATIVEVQLRVFSPPAPLTKGQPFEVYVHTASAPAILHKIVAGVQKDGVRAAARPRFLVAQSAAVVQLRFESPICLQPHAVCRGLGRLVLREAGRTLAAGIVTAILDAK